MNKLSMCCKADMIYLGKNNIKTPITQMIGDIYIIIVVQNVEIVNGVQLKKNQNINGTNLIKKN